MAKHTVTLIPGDGIGPEITTAMRRVVEATGVDIEWEIADAGEDVMDEVRHAAARARARVGPQEQGRHQGPDHHARRHRLPQRERRAAQGARPLRRTCARRSRSRAPARATTTSTSSSCARTPRTSTPASSSSRARRDAAELIEWVAEQGRRHHPPRLRHLAQADLASPAPSASCAGRSSTRSPTAARRSPPSTRPTSSSTPTACS